MTSEYLKSIFQHFCLILIFLFISAFAVTSYRPTETHAQSANFGITKDAELGTIQDPVRLGTDNLASGGKFVQFGYALDSSFTFPTKSNPSDYRAHADFIVRCEVARVAADDPIVYPGQPGAAHMHVFAGNLTTNAFSTQESLEAGQTNCTLPGDTATYWMPELYDESGNIVRPYEIRAYYRAGTLKPVTYIPKGLRMIAGNQMAMTPQSAGIAGWQCRSTTGDGNTVAKQSTIPTCEPEDLLESSVVFPNCWDGKNLDSPDHKSHMSYSNTSTDTCDTAHPIRVPQVTLAYRYPAGKTNSKAYLSAMHSALTLHADFWNTWKQNILEILIDRCVNGGVECETVYSKNFPGPMPQINPPTVHKVVSTSANNCSTVSAELGVDMLNVVIPANGSYTIWSRAMSRDKDSNTYYLQIDSGCPLEINSSSTAANTWSWTNNTNTNLTQGNHTIKLIGRNYLAKIDKILVVNNNCLPTGQGDNCVTTTSPSNNPSPTNVSSPTPTISPTSIPSPSTTASPAIPGDANNDGKVNGSDYIVWVINYNKSLSGASNGDFNNSGKVDGNDYIIWLNNYTN